MNSGRVPVIPARCKIPESVVSSVYQPPAAPNGHRGNLEPVIAIGYRDSPSTAGWTNTDDIDITLLPQSAILKLQRFHTP